jgi:hypothetical protein
LTSNKIEDLIPIDDNYFILYQSYEDVGSEYKMSKIRLNEEHFKHLSKMIKEHTITPVAFYGDFERSLEASYEYLGRIIPLKEHKVSEGIYVLKNEKKLALIYKTYNNEIFDYKNKASDQAYFVSTYLRFLIDMCQTIVISPSDDFKMNPNISNPFKEKGNRFKLEEKLIVPDEKVQIKNIPYAGEVSSISDFFKKIKTSFDQ